MRFRIILRAFAILLIISILLPLLAFDHWWVRIFDFPQLHFTILSLILLICYLFVIRKRNWRDYLFLVLLLGCFLFGTSKIWPYSILYPTTVLEATDEFPESDISVFTANVLQENDNSSELLEEVKRLDPDLVFLMEVDQQWIENLDGLKQNYPYSITHPGDHTYGLVFYSRLPLVEDTVCFLASDSIPSVYTKVRLKNGELISVYGIHPTPPMPQHNPSSADRDAELMYIAQFVRKERHPVIVMGDFNDVSWSPTTSLFAEVSGLLDIRQGRGLYNTFNSKSWIMRWPLDHIFVSKEFTLHRMEMGHYTGSDHFPLYAKLSIDRGENPEGPEEEPSDIKRAKEQIKAEAKADSIKKANSKNGD